MYEIKAEAEELCERNVEPEEMCERKAEPENMCERGNVRNKKGWARGNVIKKRWTRCAKDMYERWTVRTVPEPQELCERWNVRKKCWDPGHARKKGWTRGSVKRWTHSDTNKHAEPEDMYRKTMLNPMTCANEMLNPRTWHRRFEVADNFRVLLMKASTNWCRTCSEHCVGGKDCWWQALSGESAEAILN